MIRSAVLAGESLSGEKSTGFPKLIGRTSVIPVEVQVLYTATVGTRRIVAQIVVPVAPPTCMVARSINANDVMGSTPREIIGKQANGNLSFAALSGVPSTTVGSRTDSFSITTCHHPAA